MLKYSFSILLALLMIHPSNAQLAIKNGASITARDTLRVLMVFCEVDFSTGGCPQNLPDMIDGKWPKDENGKTQIPYGADTYFDVELKPGEKPKSIITGHYYEASLGQYILLGDYYPKVISIPCNKVRIGNNGLTRVLEELRKEEGKNGTLYTARGYVLKEFDNWTEARDGMPKLKEPDGKIDLVYLIWRNNRFLTKASTWDGTGFGINRARGIPFWDMEGVSNCTSYNSGVGSGEGARVITIAEHLHGIFGGNNWHSAGGRGYHTFIVPPNSYGLTGQYPATSQAVSGWDRWMMEWKAPGKKYVTSAFDTYGNEVKTDSITIESMPNGGVFVLRDFVTTGDALRIKLPHIDWEKRGDVKNQYLWVENRRMETEFDEYIHAECSDNGDGRFLRGTPGLYMYLQVGKDQKQGGRELYYESLEARNGLGSPFFPLTAEGNYDFHYMYDDILEGQNIACSWNNTSLPIDKKKSLPNAFTGSSDLFQIVDSNFDGKLYSGDNVQPGLSEKVRDTVIFDYYSEGDWQDAFCYATGKTKISISTNPAPVPQYTYASNAEFNQFGYNGGKFGSFENRTIWLNGLAVEIIEENEVTGDVTVRVSWDDYNISDDVRWCGNIVLNPHDFNPSLPSLNIWERKEVWLDYGYSPQYHEAKGKDKKGNFMFSDPSVFTAMEGSFINMEPKSRIVVDNGSTLVLKKGAKLVMGKKARIILKEGGKLVKEEGAQVIMKKKAKIIDRN